MARRALALQLRAIRAWDGLRLRRLAARFNGLEVHPDASTNLASARYALAPGMTIVGPALIEERESTCVIGAGDAVVVDARFNLIADLNTESRGT